MRIFWRENKMFQTVVTYKKNCGNIKKKRRMRILSARIFSKSFGGKIEIAQTKVNKETTLRKKMT